MLEAPIRWLVNWTRALMPGTLGAVSASWTATGSGSGAGFGPAPAVAIATAVVPTAIARTAAHSVSSLRVEIRRRNLITTSWGDPVDREWTAFLKIL